MPWKESHLMDERAKFIGKLLNGERMSEICREFGISRKTGYKYYGRYLKEGLLGLMDQSRQPNRHPNQTAKEIEDLVLELRSLKPTWGPKKLCERLQRLHPGVKFPVPSTMGDILKRCGVAVNPRKRRRRTVPTPGPLRISTKPNEVWCIDFKGQFRLKNGQYCYPLTLSDHYSRYLLCCEGFSDTSLAPVQMALERVFLEYGLPEAIRSDNGTPFASTGLMGWSRLSVWLLRLGIGLERIEPGHPEQNGRHERMHYTLKEDATRPPSELMLQQQERFDLFRESYNDERPHESLGMQTPGSVYLKSLKAYPGKLEDVEYPMHDVVKRVSRHGMISMGGRRPCYVSQALAYEQIGLREVEPQLWLTSFMNFDIGWYAEDKNRLVTDI
jgi:transposase InsO family protein